MPETTALRAGDHCVDESLSRPHIAHVLRVFPAFEGSPERLLCVACPREIEPGAVERGYQAKPYTVEAHSCRPAADPAGVDCGWKLIDMGAG